MRPSASRSEITIGSPCAPANVICRWPAVLNLANKLAVVVAHRIDDLTTQIRQSDAHALTCQKEKEGLLSCTDVGTKQGSLAALAEKGLRVENYCLLRTSEVAEADSQRQSVQRVCAFCFKDSSEALFHFPSYLCAICSRTHRIEVAVVGPPTLGLRTCDRESELVTRALR